MKTKRNSKLFVSDILESIDLIEKYTRRATSKKFFEDDSLQDAVIRRFEIIGEATKNIPLKIKQENPEIPWAQMAGMRNALSHEYFGITMKRIWDATQKDLPKLKKQIVKLSEKL